MRRKLKSDLETAKILNAFLGFARGTVDAFFPRIDRGGKVQKFFKIITPNVL